MTSSNCSILPGTPCLRSWASVPPACSSHLSSLQRSPSSCFQFLLLQRGQVAPGLTEPDFNASEYVLELAPELSISFSFNFSSRFRIIFCNSRILVFLIKVPVSPNLDLRTEL